MEGREVWPCCWEEQVLWDAEKEDVENLRPAVSLVGYRTSVYLAG